MESTNTRTSELAAQTRSIIQEKIALREIRRRIGYNRSLPRSFTFDDLHLKIVASHSLPKSQAQRASIYD
jgi:hypothetical protein